MLSRFNFKDIDVITDIGTIALISFGNFATTQINRSNDIILFKITLTKITMPIFINKISIIFFKTTLNKVSNAKIYMDN